MARILVVEDDEHLIGALQEVLKAEGHTVEVARTGTDGLSLLECGAFDLLILDWHIPEATGIEICNKYRLSGKTEPILFLTSRSDIADKEVAFQLGADDYLTKPFQLRELQIRVRALLRRPVATIDAGMTIGKAKFDKDKGAITLGDKIVNLQPRESDLLAFFVKRPNQVLKQQQLMAGVWGSEFEGSDVVLRACLAKVRKALATLGLDKTIVTVHGFGYQYDPGKAEEK